MKLATIGMGTMGQYTTKALEDHVDEIIVYDPNIKTSYNHASSIQEAVTNADLVIYCVPTHQVYDIMKQSLGYCKPGALISGQTSRKTPEALAFDKYAKGLEMVCIHTMCNPAKSDAKKQRLAIVRHRASDETYKRAISLFSNLSDNIEEFTVQEHDEKTANTQINASKVFLSIASSFASAQCFPWIDQKYGSGIDNMKFSLAMRAASARSHIYKGIQFGSEYGKEIAEQSLNVERELFELIVTGKKADYEKRVMNARQIFEKPLMQFEDVILFSSGTEKPNSHFSLVANAVAMTERGVSFQDDMNAATAMYTALNCMTDYVFQNDLEESIQAAFDPKIMAQDLVFHNQFQSWSQALLLDSDQLYDYQHKTMLSKLPDVSNQVNRSKEIIEFCNASYEQA